MSLPDIFIVGLYFLGLLGLGFSKTRASKRQDHQGYLLAGRKLSFPGFVASLVATWYGGVLGIGENIYLYGLQTWIIFGIPYYFFALLFALFFAGRINASKTISLPDHFYKRYGKSAGVLSAIYIFILSSPAPYILSLGFLIQYFSGLPYEISLLTVSIISVSYLWKGGFTAVVRTDYLQFSLMFLGFGLLLFYSYLHSNKPEIAISSLPNEFFDPTGGASLQYILAWFFIALWTFVDPGFYQRCSAADSKKTARKGILVSILFWMMFDGLTFLTGMYAKLLITDAKPALAYIQLAELVLPSMAMGLFIVAILSVIMSTIDSYTFISASTFGRDILWRVQVNSDKKTFNENHAIPLVKKGLLVSVLISLMLALSMPSVVEIWYTLGSVIVPGLLVPFIFSFFKKDLNIFTMMVSPVFVSILWIIIKNIYGYYPFNIEPFYPGIITSIIYGIFQWLRK
ncbi:MAG: sodium:solute symporter family protein [Candidatus Neomarinimicrobiota bacterium]|nr:hypothetical protein [Candidatus Neomarinimicrobiota bacterium]MEC7854071.1 sodium:solute symporter family protein [Candidatus Neomarinimicrobiota bacterium]MEC7981666.1 sodium:solute symporter family protein [Candidatus Neomarinimicrobiota bacterium]|tara:strand:+ start:2844 stop:4214 length:1371 start_codon:yes stop_codon:yes gene_type:complete